MNDLFTVYNLALEKNRKGAPARFEPAVMPAVNLEDKPGEILRAPASSPGGVLQLSQGGLVYEFCARDSNWNGLDVMIGTHLKPASGQIVLQVETLSGVILRKASLELREARDNEWVKFRFPELHNSKNQRFHLKFSLKDPGAATQISIYQGPTSTANASRAGRRLARLLGIRQNGGELYCREWYGH